jgi:hypothetical protein
VCRRRNAFKRSIASGPDEVALELDGREVFCIGRQMSRTRISTRGIGKRDHRGRVQISIGREQIASNVELGSQAIFIDRKDAKTD